MDDMWTWTLNWGDITPDIVVGSCPMTPDDVRRIRRETGASALLSLQHNDCLAHWNINETELHRAGQDVGLRMVRCAMRDFSPVDARRVLPLAVRLLAALQSDDHRTYVHCTAGLGRAPVTVWSYLVFVAGYTSDDAYRILKQGRPDAVPAWEALDGARIDLVEQHRTGIEKRAYELHQQGQNGGADAHWHQAVQEVLRDVLTP